MKINEKLKLQMITAIAVISTSLLLVSFTKKETVSGSYRIDRQYTQGRTFYILLDRYDNPIGFKE